MSPNATPAAVPASGTGPTDFVAELLAADGGFSSIEGRPAEDTNGTARTDANPAATPTDGAAPVGDGTEPAQEAAEPATPQPEQTLETLAAEYGLDLNNPKQRELIESLLSKRDAADPNATGGEEGSTVYEALTEYEKSLLAPPEPDAAASKPGEEHPLEPGKFGDVGDAWESPEQAMAALQEAWSGDDEGKTDFKKVYDIDTALWVRRFAHIAQPLIQRQITAALREQLGPYFEEAQRSKAVAQYNGNLTEAINGLKAVKGLEDIEAMLKPLSDKPLKVKRGNEVREVADSVYNRILAERPELVDMVIDRDPVTGRFLNEEQKARMTQIARLKAAHRDWKRTKGTVPADRLPEVVKAAATNAQRSQEQRTLQTFNAGSSASAAGTRNTQGDFVSELNRVSAQRDGMKLTDVF